MSAAVDVLARPVTSGREATTMSQMTLDYERIAQALRYLEENVTLGFLAPLD